MKLNPAEISKIPAYRHRIHELYQRFDEQENPLGCFDALYEESGADIGKIPWARERPNPGLVAWQGTLGKSERPDANRALVVGCGLGDDAEFLSGNGWAVTAFDLSPHAIQWARRRFPKSAVNYLTADLFRLSSDFYRAFDFVFESNTVQSIPVALRQEAICAITGTVASGGRLLAVPRGRNDREPLGSMPWPLSRSELRLFEKYGLRETFFSDQWLSQTEGSIRIFQAEYIRPAAV